MNRTDGPDSNVHGRLFVRALSVITNIVYL